MKFKKLISGLCCSMAVLFLCSTAVGSEAFSYGIKGSKTLTLPTQNVYENSAKKDFAPSVTHKLIEGLTYRGSKTIQPENFEATYSEVNYRSIVGEKAKVSISNNKLLVDADAGVSVDVAIVDYNTGKTAAYENGSNNIELDFADKLDTYGVYYIELDLHFVANEYYDDALLISVDKKGNLFFVEAPIYQYNFSQFSSLLDTDEYIQKCLESTRDMEADNIDIKAFGDELCKGALTDYEKVSRIYDFIVDDMYYNYDMVYHPEWPFQDDALCLIRSQVAVCEGFSNVFVALCRSQGIPATEMFGFAGGYDEMWAMDYTRYFSSNHAWVSAFIDGSWYILDPTWDNGNSYVGGKKTEGESTRQFLFIPLESFSYSHLIMNADISHAKVREGSCGDDARYVIDENGYCTIYGTGSICMPDDEEMDFFKVIFDEESEITEIADECFINCDLLDAIIIPDTVTRIGDYAFYHSENLEYCYIPDSVEYIGECAFWVCDKLAYVEIPDGTTVGKDAFDQCPRLVLSVENKNQVSFDGYDCEIAKLIIRK